MAELDHLKAAMASEGLTGASSTTPTSTTRTADAAKLAHELGLWRQLALGKDAAGQSLTDEARSALQLEVEELSKAKATANDAKRRKVQKANSADAEMDDDAPLVPNTSA